MSFNTNNIQSYTIALDGTTLAANVPIKLFSSDTTSVKFEAVYSGMTAGDDATSIAIVSGLSNAAIALKEAASTFEAVALDYTDFATDGASTIKSPAALAYAEGAGNFKIIVTPDASPTAGATVTITVKGNGTPGVSQVANV